MRTYDTELMIIAPYINGKTESEIKMSIQHDLVNHEGNFSHVYYILHNVYRSRIELLNLLRDVRFVSNLIQYVQTNVFPA